MRFLQAHLQNLVEDCCPSFPRPKLFQFEFKALAQHVYAYVHDRVYGHDDHANDHGHARDHVYVHAPFCDHDENVHALHDYVHARDDHDHGYVLHDHDHDGEAIYP